MKTTLLTDAQIWGDNALDVIKKYGPKVARTDLAGLLGCYCLPPSDFKEQEKNLVCHAWSASSYVIDWVCCVGDDGDRVGYNPRGRDVGVRPVLPLSETSKIRPSSVRVDASGVKIGVFGEYPQTVADRLTNAQLEKLYQSGLLQSTGKNYTYDSAELLEFGVAFKPETHAEYEYEGKKYIRVFGNQWNNGKFTKIGGPYWVCVEPIEWLMDKKTGIWVSRKCLFSGVQFDGRGEKYYGDFENTAMAAYLKDYFDYEMLPTEEYLKVKGLVVQKQVSNKHKKIAKHSSKSKNMKQRGRQHE